MGGVPLRFCGECRFGADALDAEPLARHAVGSSRVCTGRRVPLERRGHRRHGGHHYGRSTGCGWVRTAGLRQPRAIDRPSLHLLQRDYYLFLPPPSAVVSQLLVPYCGIGGVPMDRGHGTLVVGGNPGTRRGTDSRGALDGDQPAANLARLHGPGGNTIFYSEDHRPRIIQPSMGSVRVLDAADPRRLG